MNQDLYVGRPGLTPAAAALLPAEHGGAATYRTAVLI
jgi:hypothetical protein